MTMMHYPVRRSVRSSIPMLAADGAAALARFAAHMWNAHRNRRQIAKLLEMDDYMLADIGVSRGDIQSALMGDVFEDPSSRLAAMRGGRRFNALARRKSVKTS
ncbi:DUF1127 domain-containing protein [Rhizobiales bacterium]|uniref:DUF1127 domain-containing protein n=1 Tax=Hongsoonwoonella zoysiae TaxID=2821844 RepID=UPI00155FFE5D|nr:DUF1127 domain-containing protein [Hongsoonwoonella zoysiae]NRG19897.1 DUF1127 domain-containing protein [Hongsoonwoonella zoysiae]